MDKFRDITFNGRTLHSFGFFLKKGTPIIDFPPREVSTTLIAGSVVGDAITDKGTYGNIERTYSFRTIPSQMPKAGEGEFLKSFIEWAKDNRDSYGKLYDTARRGYFCNAFLKEITDFQKNGKFYDVTLKFSCQPYWYLESGMDTIKKISPSTSPFSFDLVNPESFTSYPYFKLSFSSATVSAPTVTLTVNDNSLVLTGITDYIEIDSEIMQVFKGNVPKNNVLSSTSIPKLPEFKSGINEITITPTDPARWTVECVPRWRCM